MYLHSHLSYEDLHLYPCFTPVRILMLRKSKQSSCLSNIVSTSIMDTARGRVYLMSLKFSCSTVNSNRGQSVFERVRLTLAWKVCFCIFTNMLKKNNIVWISDITRYFSYNRYCYRTKKLYQCHTVCKTTSLTSIFSAEILK